MPQPQSLRIPIEPFRWDRNDPLAKEYEWVARLVSETLKTDWKYYYDLDLNTTEAGKRILEASPETTARLVLALVAHASHYDALIRQVRSLAENEMERMNAHLGPEWEKVWPLRQISAQTLRRIMRRKLPLTREHLVKLADWIAQADWLSDVWYPLNGVVKAIETHGKIDSADDALRTSVSRLASVLRAQASKEGPKFAQRIEPLLGLPTEESAASSEPTGPDASRPAPAGSPAVLSALKVFLGTSLEENPASEPVGLDRFFLRADSPLKDEHEVITLLLAEGTATYYELDLSTVAVGRNILARDPFGRGRMLLAFAERCANADLVPPRHGDDPRVWQSIYALNGAFRYLIKQEYELDRDGVFDLLLFLSALNRLEWLVTPDSIEKLVIHVEQHATAQALAAGERHVLYRVRCCVVRTAPFGRPSQLAARIGKLIYDGLCIALVPGEAWTDTVNAELSTMAPTLRENWLELLRHVGTASGSRPSSKWLKTAKERLKKIGDKSFSEALLRWFPLLNLPRTIRLLAGSFGGASDTTGTIHQDNATCLRGLVWIAPEVVSADLIRAWAL